MDCIWSKSKTNSSILIAQHFWTALTMLSPSLSLYDHITLWPQSPNVSTSGIIEQWSLMKCKQWYGCCVCYVWRLWRGERQGSTGPLQTTHFINEHVHLYPRTIREPPVYLSNHYSSMFTRTLRSNLCNLLQNGVQVTWFLAPIGEQSNRQYCRVPGH